MIDITIARLNHLDMELYLEGAIFKEDGDTFIKTHYECELGAWLYERGISQYHDIKEIHELEAVHKTYHEVAKRLVEWHNTNTKHAQRAANDVNPDLLELKRLSKEVIYLLTIIENKQVSLEISKDIKSKRHERAEILNVLSNMRCNPLSRQGYQTLLMQLKSLIEEKDSNRILKLAIIEKLLQIGCSIIRRNERLKLFDELKMLEYE